MKIPALILCASLLAAVTPVLAQLPIVPSTPVEATRVPIFTPWQAAAAERVTEHPAPLANFRLHLDYRLPDAGARAAVQLGEKMKLPLPAGEPGKWQTVDLEYEQLKGQAGSLTASVGGRPLPGTGKTAALETGGVLRLEAKAAQEQVPMGSDFTAVVRFTSRGNGALFARCGTGKWEPDAKMLGLRDGKLFYDIGWLGVINGKTAGLTDGRGHTAVVRLKEGKATLFIDGKVDAQRDGHTRPDAAAHGFQIGRGAEGFDGDLRDGSVEGLTFWKRALNNAEVNQLSTGQAGAVNTPDFEWKGGPGAKATFPQGIPGVAVKLALATTGAVEVRDAWVQPLGEADHAGLISQWNDKTLADGAKIYQTLCVTCHGTLTAEGSMPTSRHFQREPFKNGNDPFRMFQTLTQGYGLMPPMPQYTTEQKYAVIQYIRQTFVAAQNKAELFTVTPDYLAALPRAMRTLEHQAPPVETSQPYEKMNFGPALMWTYQVDAGTPAPQANFAYKGIAIRLDPGEGGVSKGRAWMVYDHDTMRVAAATTGSFVDWKGVAFDGSHNSHTSLTGTRSFTNPIGPGWANPETGKWDDPRFKGRDGRLYGPLPREWAHYVGTYYHGSRVVVRYTVGTAEVLDAPEFIDYGTSPVFIRTLNVGQSARDLDLRVASESDAVTVRVAGSEAASLSVADGFHVLHIPAKATPLRFRIGLGKGLDAASLDALAKSAQVPLDLAELTRGGPPRWPQVVTTQSTAGPEDGPFATDVLTAPDLAANPWNSWMRLTGFDFLADPNQAAVCTWMGDVWIVEGLATPAPAELKWRRIATGLFQPLGLKIINGVIHVCCRDQIARLRDLNGDGETDYIESFNNDHQVTEHFHEFAMGLQSDAAGNLYYAKSARHALPALVAHHGTLLRVSPDGQKTDIIATGFRAANGVCLNPDGTFFVTDQEGHWTPKNRINLVHPSATPEFFGNMFGYHDVTDTSNTAMKQPLCWITNAFDRSPSELLWVPREAKWGPLNGALLNLSYGYGRIYTVPYETVNGQPQGGLCALPMPQFPTGVMRGRFGPADGQFYGCGMFAWAGNQVQPGGFYRVRYTGKPALQPLGVHFEKGSVTLTFSDPLDPATAADAARCAVKAWNLKRSASYGSNHVDEHPLPVTRAELTTPTTLKLTIPDLAPTMGLEISCTVKSPGGADTTRVMHATVHEL